MTSKGKKLSLILAIFMSLIFVLGVFFSSFVDKDSDKCDHEWYLFKTLTNVTCESDGIMLVSCSHCSSFERRVIPAMGHTLESGTAPVFPTCTATGMSESIRCATCYKTINYPEVVPALGHNLVVVPGRQATCLEPGLTDGQKCDRCGMVSVLQKPIQGDHIDENTDGICDFCGVSNSDWFELVEVPVQQDESVVGNTYRIYPTSYLSGLCLSSDNNISIFFDPNNSSYVFMSGPLYQIRGLNVQVSDGYIDITFETGTFEVIRTDTGAVTTTFTIDENTVVTRAPTSVFRLEKNFIG